VGKRKFCQDGIGRKQVADQCALASFAHCRLTSVKKGNLVKSRRVSNREARALECFVWPLIWLAQHSTLLRLSFAPLSEFAWSVVPPCLACMHKWVITSSLTHSSKLADVSQSQHKQQESTIDKTYSATPLCYHTYDMGVPMLRHRPTADWLQKCRIVTVRKTPNQTWADFHYNQNLCGISRKPDARETT
jgi:hypothetical protein